MFSFHLYSVLASLNSFGEKIYIPCLIFPYISFKLGIAPKLNTFTLQRRECRICFNCLIFKLLCMWYFKGTHIGKKYVIPNNSTFIYQRHVLHCFLKMLNASYCMPCGDHWPAGRPQMFLTISLRDWSLFQHNVFYFDL